jgi:hypothetical protein
MGNENEHPMTDRAERQVGERLREQAREIGWDVIKFLAVFAPASVRNDDLARQLAEAERVLRRKCVLDNYGITIENVEFDRWLEIVSSDEELEKWFGQPLSDYILSDLQALSLNPPDPPASPVCDEKRHVLVGDRSDCQCGEVGRRFADQQESSE